MEKADFYLLKSKEIAPDGLWRDIYVHRILTNMPDDKNLVITLYPEFAERRIDLEGLFSLYSRIKDISGVFSKSFWEPVKYEMYVEQPSWSRTPTKKEWENKIGLEDLALWTIQLEELL